MDSKQCQIMYTYFKRYDRTQNLSLILLHVGCCGGSVVLFYLSDDANITVNVMYVINSLFSQTLSLYKNVLYNEFRDSTFSMYNARFSYCTFVFPNEFLSLV